MKWHDRAPILDKEREAMVRRVYGALRDSDKHDFDETLFRAQRGLTIASHVITSIYDDFFRAYDLTPAKFWLLSWLAACEKSGYSDGSLPSELSKLQGTSPNTISTVLKGLRKQGLVTFTRHPNDHRKRIVAITEEGRALITRVRSAYAPLISKTLGGLSREERETLAGLLEKLTASIVAARGDPHKPAETDAQP